MAFVVDVPDYVIDAAPGARVAQEGLAAMISLMIRDGSFTTCTPSGFSTFENSQALIFLHPASAIR